LFSAPAVFFSISGGGDKYVSSAGHIDDACRCGAAKNQNVKANGLAGTAKRISKRVRERMRSYEQRERIFNWAVIVVALIALTILIVWLTTAWMAFEKSLNHTL